MSVTIGDYILWLAIAACVIFLAALAYAALQDSRAKRD